METTTSSFGQSMARRLGGIIREFRSSLENPQTPLNFPAEWMLDIFNGGRTDSGVRVSEMTALQVATVFTCVNIISNAVAGLPFQHLRARKIWPAFFREARPR